MYGPIKTKLKEFYNNLESAPLEPSDPFYVEFFNRPSGDTIKNLFTQISWSDAASIHLLTGQRGSGKSTELRRLKQMLEDDGCVVFLVDMLNYMNMTTPVEITDFFISIMGALSDQVKKKYGTDASNESYLDRLISFLFTEIDIKEFKFKGGVEGFKAGLTASLKDDPSFRELIQKKAKGHVAKIVEQAHSFGVHIVDFIRKESNDKNKKVVLIIDSVEQIRGVGSDADTVYKSVQNLFSGHASSLNMPLLHVVYTIPPYLTPLTPNLGRLLGGGVICNLPSVHIMNRDNTPDKNGLDIMKKIVEKRITEWREIFNEPDIEKIALLTGGDLRDYFRYLRQCLTSADSVTLPINDSIITDVENTLRRDMLPLSLEDMKWLKKINLDKTPHLESIEKLPHLARFFDTNLVLTYRNGNDWYDIHPLLKDIIKDKTS